MSDNLIVAIIVVGGWIFSLCFHEFGHAITAYIGGDKSVREKGYLTLNPLIYTNFSLSIVLPTIFLLLGGIGLPGAAVLIDTTKLRSRHWRSLVSLAGPLFSLVFTLLLLAAIKLALLADPNQATESVYVAAGAFLAVLEVVVIILNLLPVPGLDGFGIIEPYLATGIKNKLAPLYKYGFWIVFLTLYLVRPLNVMLWGTAYFAIRSAGVSIKLLSDGRTLFREGSMPFAIGCIALAAVFHFIRNRKENGVNDSTVVPDRPTGPTGSMR